MTLITLSQSEIKAHMQAVIEAVATVPEEDLFSFQVSQPIESLGTAREFIGYLFSMTARLDSRIFDIFHIDFTVGDALVQPLDTVRVGEIFGFVEGLLPVQIPCNYIGQHFAVL